MGIFAPALTEAAAEQGLTLAKDDGLIAFALVNEAVLREAMKQASDEVTALLKQGGEDITTRIASFNASIDKLERRAGEALGQQCAKLINEVRRQLLEAVSTAAQARESEAKKAPYLPMWAHLVLAGMAGFVLGIVGAQVIG